LPAFSENTKAFRDPLFGWEFPTKTAPSGDPRRRALRFEKVIGDKIKAEQSNTSA